MTDAPGIDRDARINRELRGCDENAPGCVSQQRVELLEAEIFKAIDRQSKLVEEFNHCQQTVVGELGKVTQRLDAIPDHKHTRHHDLLDRLIEERELRVMFWTEIRNKLATASIMGAFGILGAALLFAAKAWLKQQGHG